MRVKKLGLGLSAVAALAIPVLSTATFKVRAAGALDGDLVALDLEQGTSPFLITPRRLALEDDLIFLISIGFGLSKRRHLTWVLSSKLERSKVVPDGTVMPESTIVAQDA